MRLKLRIAQHHLSLLSLHPSTMTSGSIDSVCQRVIIDYLSTHGLDETLETFKRETLQNRVRLPSTPSSSSISPSLQFQSLIAAHLSLNHQDEQDHVTDESSQTVLIEDRSDSTLDEDEESDIPSNNDTHPTMDSDSTISHLLLYQTLSID